MPARDHAQGGGARSRVHPVGHPRRHGCGSNRLCGSKFAGRTCGCAFITAMRELAIKSLAWKAKRTSCPSVPSCRVRTRAAACAPERRSLLGSFEPAPIGASARGRRRRPIVGRRREQSAARMTPAPQDRDLGTTPPSARGRCVPSGVCDVSPRDEGSLCFGGGAAASGPHFDAIIRSQRMCPRHRSGLVSTKPQVGPDRARGPHDKPLRVKRAHT